MTRSVIARVGRSLGARLALALMPLALAACPDRKDPGASGAAADAADAVDASRPAPTAPVNALPIPSASVAAALGADKLPAYKGPTGSLEGTIWVKGDPAPSVDADFSKCPAGAKTFGKLFRDGPPNEAGLRPLADAFVGVTGYTGYYLPETREAKLATLEDCAFAQRTIDLTFGQRLDISNRTSALFAPALSGFSTPALMIAPPHGDAVRLYPPKPGYYTMSDRFEGVYLREDVYVVLHPLHTVTDRAGHYRIDGIPAKTKLTVFARLAVIGEASTEIEVLPSVVAKADLTLTFAPKDAGAPQKPKDAGYTPPR
jgi:hypothetical protein